MTESTSWVAQLQRDAAQRIDQVIAAQEAMSRVRGEARSPRGEVIAASGPTGAPTSLELSEAALELRPAELAAMIVSTQQQAAAVAARRAAEVLAPIVGSEQADAMLSARLTPAKVDELRRERDTLGAWDAEQDGPRHG